MGARVHLTSIVLQAVCAAACHRANAPTSDVVLPTRYAEHRFFVRPVTAVGDTMTLFTDTGGGLWLSTAAVERARLPVAVVGVEGKDTLRAVSLPAFRADASIPTPLGAEGGRLFVMTPDDPWTASWSGMLGQQWFADRVWTFDYPGRRLVLRAAAPAHDAAHTVPLGFKTAPSGRRATHFPRIRAVVDGDTLDLLFDTGASTSLTDSALAAVGDGAPAERATSFIVATIFDRWRARHPDWRVIERAEARTGAAMIEVPAVTVAGYTVGPVWFTRRADANFHSYMSQWMDRRVEGALGGSALRYFRVTVDYPRAEAHFERP